MAVPDTGLTIILAGIIAADPYQGGARRPAGLDDYFNPAFPGVCEEAIRFWLAHDGAPTPIAAGFNKVPFQKAPAPFDLNAAFKRRFPYIPHKTVTLWETPIHSFSSLP
jgi:hypothetical protein